MTGGLSAPRLLAPDDHLDGFDSGGRLILLGWLAVDRNEQGAGLGADLLRDAITGAVTAAELIGVRALILHAMHQQAQAFYRNFGFEPSPTDDRHLY